MQVWAPELTGGKRGGRAKTEVTSLVQALPMGRKNRRRAESGTRTRQVPGWQLPFVAKKGQTLRSGQKPRVRGRVRTCTSLKPRKKRFEGSTGIWESSVPRSTAKPLGFKVVFLCFSCVRMSRACCSNIIQLFWCCIALAIVDCVLMLALSHLGFTVIMGLNADF